MRGLEREETCIQLHLHWSLFGQHKEEIFRIQLAPTHMLDCGCLKAIQKVLQSEDVALIRQQPGAKEKFADSWVCRIEQGGFSDKTI